jgi:hypothetical protein
MRLLTRLISPRLARTQRELATAEAKLEAAHTSLIDLRRIASDQKRAIGSLSLQLGAQRTRAERAEQALGDAKDRYGVLASGVIHLMESWERLGRVGSVEYAAGDLRGLLQQLGALVAHDLMAAPAEPSAPVGNLVTVPSGRHATTWTPDQDPAEVLP